MILSRYILGLAINGGKEALLYNPLANSMVVSDKPKYCDVGNLSRDIENKTVKAQDFAVLREQGFLSQCLSKDYERASKIYNDFHDDKSSLNITVLPTYSCNFGCKYCFERKLKKTSTMAESTVSSAIKWAGDKIDSLKPKEINLVFFGGEPLLCKKEVLNMAEQIHKKATSSNVEVNIDLITNGYLLEDETVCRLSDLGLKNIKVTLDGIAEYHDMKRSLKNGGPTFEKILSNLLRVHKYCKLLIGINFDDQNEAGIRPLLDLLRNSELRDSISSVSVKHIMSDGSQKEHLSCHRTVKEFERSLVYTRYAKSLGFDVFDRVNLGPCDANRSASFTIDPRGLIYLCPAAAGQDSLAVGSVFEGFNGNFDRFMNSSPLNNDECMSCKYLPMCFGGCRLLSFYKTGDFNGVSCEKNYFESIAPALLKLEIEDSINL